MAQRTLDGTDFQQLLHELSTSAPEAPDERLRFIQRFVADKIAGAAATDLILKASLPEDRDIYLDLGASVYKTLIPMSVGEFRSPELSGSKPE